MSSLPLWGDSVASFWARKGSPAYDFLTLPRVTTAPLTDAQRALYESYYRSLTLSGVTEYELGTPTGTTWNCAYCSSQWARNDYRCKSCGAPRR